jgi:hypothetical protein
MGSLPDGRHVVGPEDAVIERQDRSDRQSAGGPGDREVWTMSASTRAIQQPIGKGSIFGAVALAAAVLLAALAITWGAANLTATRATVGPVPVPVLLDKGSRGELAPATGTQGSVIDRFERDDQQIPVSTGGFGGYGGPRMGSAVSNGGHGGRLAQ